MHRPLVSLVLLATVLALATPTQANAQPVADGPAAGDAADAALVELEALERAANWRELAQKAEAELARRPESAATFEARNRIASMALFARRNLARDAGRDCASVNAGIELADAYLKDLQAAHGEALATDGLFKDAVAGVSELRQEFEQLYQTNACEAPAATTTPEPEPSPPPPAPAPAPEPRSPRGLKIGVAVTGALTGAMLAVSLGTGLSRYREPFQGLAYKNIYDAAVAAGHPHSDTDDMCANSPPETVQKACDRWETLGTTAIATGVVTGVLGVTTIALTALLVRKQRQYERASALLRRHQPSLTAAPALRGGMNMALGFRF